MPKHLLRRQRKLRKKPLTRINSAEGAKCTGSVSRASAAPRHPTFSMDAAA
jgi:hypothetical protein